MAGDRGADDAKRRDGADQVSAGVGRDGVDGPHVRGVDHRHGEVAGLVGGDREHREFLRELGGDPQQRAPIHGVEHGGADARDHELAVEERDDAVLVGEAEVEQRLDEGELALCAAGLNLGELVVRDQARPDHHGSEETQAATMIHRRRRAVNNPGPFRGEADATGVEWGYGWVSVTAIRGR